MYARTGLYKPRQGTAAQQYCPHAVLLGRVHEVPFWHPLGKNSKQFTCWAGWHLGCIATTLGAPPNCPMGLVAIREAYSEYQ